MREREIKREGGKKKRGVCSCESAFCDCAECNSLGNYPSRRRYNYDYIAIRDDFLIVKYMPRCFAILNAMRNLLFTVQTLGELQYDLKMHDFDLSLLRFSIENEPPCDLHYVTGRRCSSDATCDLARPRCASSGGRGSRDNAARRRRKTEKKRKMMTKKKKKKTTKSRGGGGRRGRGRRGERGRGGGGGGGGGGEGKRSSSVKHVTRIERTSRHSALRPRYTASMAAEGRIGGGQPRRQPMSS